MSSLTPGCRQETWWRMFSRRRWISHCCWKTCYWRMSWTFQEHWWIRWRQLELRSVCTTSGTEHRSVLILLLFLGRRYNWRTDENENPSLCWTNNSWSIIIVEMFVCECVRISSEEAIFYVCIKVKMCVCLCTLKKSWNVWYQNWAYIIKTYIRLYKRWMPKHRLGCSI